MSDETSEIETVSVEIGGPTVFLQAPDGVWGEFELPKGVRIENGDGFNIFDCRFLGVLYREFECPKRPTKDETSEEVLAAYRMAREIWLKDMEREDVRMTWGTGKLVSLLPLNEFGR